MQAKAGNSGSAVSGLRNWRPWAGRVPISRRSLLHDRIRFTISVGGMGFAVVLVLLLRGIMDGTVAKSTTYIDRVGADVFVSSAGVRNMSLASSALPEAMAEQARATSGVADAGGIVRMEVMASKGEAARPAVMVGYSPGHIGGPWKLASGRGVERDGEAVVDSVLAGQLGLSEGGTFGIADSTFTVVGRSTETTAIAGKLVFVSLGDAQATLRMPGLVTFVLLRLQPGEVAEPFVARLAQAAPETTVQTRESLSNNDREVLGGLFIAPVNVMSTAGLLVGLAIVGLTMYTTTTERLRDFGVLKAIGASNAYLFRTVLVQALVLALLSFVAGVAIVLVATPIVERWEPDIGVDVGAAQAGIALAEVLAMSFLGAILPLARILRVDPLEAFRR